MGKHSEILPPLDTASVEEVCKQFTNDNFFSLVNKQQATNLKIIEEHLIRKYEEFKNSNPTSKKEVKLWIGVLWALCDISYQDNSLAMQYGRMAWEKSLEIQSSKFMVGSACRVGLLGDLLPMQAVLEIRQDFHNILLYWAKTLFLIFIKTGKMADEAHQYCLYASLFDKNYETYYEMVISQKSSTLSIEEIKKEIHNAISFGLPYCKLVNSAINRIRKDNYVGCNKNELLELQDMEQLIPCDVNPLKLKIDIEKFVCKGVWNEDEYLGIMKNRPSMSMLHRLRETFNALEVKNDHSSYETHYPLLSINLVRKFFQFSLDFIESADFKSTEFEQDIALCPISVLLVADYLMERSQPFISVYVLLHFVKLAEKWFRMYGIFSNNQHTSAHWYFVMIRCYERSMTVFPDHPQVGNWKKDIERLSKIKEGFNSDFEYESD